MTTSATGWRRRAVSWLTTLVMVAALVLATLMILPTLLGYERYVIVSGSMEPTIPTGALVYDEVVPVEEIEVGDIITFVPPPEFGITTPVTHRVVMIDVTGENTRQPGLRVFRTQGDANDDVDPWKMVLDGEEQGRYVRHLPYIGYVYWALQQRWVQLLVIAIPSIVLVSYIAVSLWRISGDGVREEQRLEAERRAELAGREAGP